MSTSFKINRFVVYRNAVRVADFKFHDGVNIIRGDNGVGKTTIVDLIAYTLGAEFVDWTRQQLSCDAFFLELTIRGSIFVAKREPVTSGQAPIAFTEAGLDEALQSSTNWMIYPSRYTSQRRSFSAHYFNLMGIPWHTTENQDNLTMHQILRLIYANQSTNAAELMNSERAFDSAVMRRAVGEYLLGIDDLEAHELRQNLIKRNKEFESINGELKAIYRILGSSVDSFNQAKLEENISVRQSEVDRLEMELIEAASRPSEEVKADVSSALEAISSKLTELADKKANASENIGSLKREKLDTVVFLESIDSRLHAIEMSSNVKDELLQTEFKYCPSCLKPIKQIDDKEHYCPLCKSDITSEDPLAGHMRVITELNFQKTESVQVLDLLDGRLDELNVELRSIDAEQSSKKLQYLAIESSGSIDTAYIGKINREIGFNQSQIEQLQAQLQSIEKVTRLQEQKAEASKDISLLQDAISSIEESAAERSQAIYVRIEEIAKNLLAGDEGYEEAFDKVEEVAIEFSRNSMWVNGIRRYSASSRVIMKNAIRIAIFLGCLEDKKTRFPSLLLIDGMEEAGMQRERSQNFQKVIVDRLGELDKNFQLIFTTSMVADELRESEFGVGPFYRKGEHTLDIEDAV